MATIKIKTLSFATSAALVASLGLAACGGTSSSSSSSEPAAEAPATETPATDQAAAAEGTVAAKYKLEKVWVGSVEDTQTMFYEGAGKQTGAFLIFHVDTSQYELWLGKMESPAENQYKITDDETGETFGFTITSTDSDGTIEVESDRGDTARMSPDSMEYLGVTLDTIGTYASKVGEPSKTTSEAGLGGEYLLKFNTDGLGQVAFSQNGEEPFFGDSAFTHANAGDTIKLSTQSKGGTFVKWTKDGVDYSTDPEITIAVDGDAEYVAVFTYE